MRHEARIKLGYYPTPLTVVERVRSFLSFPERNVNILDPCCGEGRALKNLVEGASTTTYGIELDDYRAERAKAMLDNVLKGSYEDARVTNNAFSCLFLNPPYDWESGGMPEEGSGDRKEKTFLRGTVKYIQPNDVLVYIVPQKRVSNDIANLLPYRFDDFNYYRFPDEEYERFGEIVMFWAKKPEGYIDGESLERLRGVRDVELDEIPYLYPPA